MALLVVEGRAVVVAGHELEAGGAPGVGHLPGYFFGGLFGVGGDGVGLDHYEPHQAVRVAVYDVALEFVLEGVATLVRVGVEDSRSRFRRSPSRRS